MKPLAPFLALLILSGAICGGEPALSGSRAPSIESLKSTDAEHEARLSWWRQARFGMFVHWGASSVLGGSWQGKGYGGYAEHIQRARKIPMDVYRKEVVEKFNPTGFNAEEWIQLADDAGVGYFIITAKHHDGFAMFDSKASDYNIVKATPFKRDPMRELKAACVKHGIKFGFYYSHAFDWGEENAPGNDWDWKNPGGDKLLHGSDWWKTYPEFLPRARKYVDEKAIPQLLELIRQYDPDIIWFDTPHKLPPEENLRIFAAVRKANPKIVMNGRIFSGANPELHGLTDYLNTADKPAEFLPRSGDWESIPTTNESYGHNKNDHSHKPASHFIRLLAKSAARGGNMLMNMGPMGDGRVDPKDVSIFKEIGRWMKVNAQSIRGTTRTPLAVQAWGESTVKGNTLYLHVFDWPKDGKLVVGGLRTSVKSARLLAGPDAPLTSRRRGADLLIDIPVSAADPADTVIVLECDGPPAGDSTRLIATNVSENQLRVFDAQLKGKLSFGAGKSTDAHVLGWDKADESVVWPVRLNEDATFEATLCYDAPGTTQAGKREGDAGQEAKSAHQGAGGSFIIHIGGKSIPGTVKQGNRIQVKLGEVTLDQGVGEIRITAGEITGQELFRPRSITLKPIPAH